MIFIPYPSGGIAQSDTAVGNNVVIPSERRYPKILTTINVRLTAINVNSVAACPPLSLRSLVHVVSLAAGILSTQVPCQRRCYILYLLF